MNDISKAFSNLTRMKLISCLARSPKNVTQLIENCGLSQSAVSQHLIKLKESGIVECEKKGREQVYKLKFKEAGEISQKIINLMKKIKG